MSLVGRLSEQKQLLKKLRTDKAELVAILGRRRIGKTFLVSETYNKHISFQFTGLYRGTLKEQLSRFSHALAEYYTNGVPLAIPASWFDAFDLLKKFIETKKYKTKTVIFLDEFPWLSTNKSRFLTAFTDFWNSYGSTNPKLILVICGSSASWMINNVIKNKGGLHNRITDRIFLAPFNLAECEAFLKHKNRKIDRQGIVALYMAFGGIPYYLDQIDQGESVDQAVDRLCFTKGALLRLEYDELFSSLFGASEKHEKIIEVLSKTPSGLNRDDISRKTKIKSGGGFSKILEELEHTGFIMGEVPYGNTKYEKLYKLLDFYTLFYLKYIQNTKPAKNGWQKIASMATWKSWSDLAFERVCKYHLPAIKKALNIDGIISEDFSWYNSSTDTMHGAQIDLLIDRADGIINICEIKYSNTPFVINLDYLKRMKLKLTAFKYFTKTKKVLFPTLITSQGLVENKHSIGFVQNTVILEQLFL